MVLPQKLKNLWAPELSDITDIFPKKTVGHKHDKSRAARLRGQKATGGKAELCFLIEKQNPEKARRSVKAYIKHGKRLFWRRIRMRHSRKSEGGGRTIVEFNKEI
jgi:hypothetical protein